VVVAAAPDGVMLAGEKLQDAPDGSPEQLNETAAENPFCGVTVMVAVPGCPDAALSADGATVTEKFGAGPIVYEAEARALLANPFNTPIAMICSETLTVNGFVYFDELVVGLVPSVV
jgi:hypothetical protein